MLILNLKIYFKLLNILLNIDRDLIEMIIEAKKSPFLG